jgi:hypothetical protein
MKPMLAGMLAVALVAAPCAAQITTRLTLSGFNGNIGNTVESEIAQGFADGGNDIVFRVAITGGDNQRATSVFIRANAATFTGGAGTKPASDGLWRRNDLATWVPLTTTDALIESQTIQTYGTSWSNSIWLRCNVSWLTDPPANYSLGLTFTLVVAAP